MNKSILCLATACLWNSAQAQWSYPPTKTVAASNTYFGKTYSDPYRWLENLQDKEVEAWFKAQAELTDSLLRKIPSRDLLAEEWKALDKIKPASYSSISCRNGRVFYKKTAGGENVGKLFVRAAWGEPETELFDPTPYKPGVVSTIQSIVPSFDGKYVALGISKGGAEISEIRVLDVNRSNLLPDTIDVSYGPMSWTPDNQGFFYDAGSVSDPRAVEFHLNRKVRLHRLGVSSALDPEILSKEADQDLKLAPEEFPVVEIDECLPGYLLGGAYTAQNELRMFYAPIAELTRPKVRWAPLCERSDNLVRDLGFHGQQAFAITHSGAPKYKVVTTNIKNPDWKRANTVIPEGPDAVQYFATSKDFLFVVYSTGILGRVVQYEFASGKVSELRLPRSGTVNVECPDPHSDRCLISITSWTTPTVMYDYNPETGVFAKSIFNTEVSYPGFENLVSEEVEVAGHDGTMIPLSIIHKKDLVLDGSNSCILEGYGAYGISYQPTFNIRTSVATRGVVLAFAHVRGGGEKGEAWHKAGFKTTKPNTWKDFLSCAEYMIKKGYTSPGKLAGTGTSAGGILISRAITERPDLFAAAVCNVGDADAMRSEFGTDGPANSKEYGSVMDEAECQALYEMDGVQHVRKGVAYPAVLGVGGWNDPRVAAWQPGKFIAALQSDSSSKKPVLMKVNYDNGHFTEEKTVTFKNFASQYSFLLWQTGHKDFQPLNDDPSAPSR
jgi:prolyl oligopeptidase